MANNNLPDLYKQIVQKLDDLNQSNNSETGCLSKTIQIIVGEEKSSSPETTEEICNYFGIKFNSSIEEDIELIRDWWDVIFADNKIHQLITKWFINIQNFLKNRGGYMTWIIIIIIGTALAAVAIYGYNKVNSQQKNESVPGLEFQTQERKQDQDQLPADLCLVIPAFIANDLENGSKLNYDELIDIINRASYFLCTTDMKSKVKLNTTNEPPSSDSMREFYIKININDGRNLINKKTRYSLKENLSQNVQGNIEELKCLMDLSGLEEFNRI